MLIFARGEIKMFSEPFEQESEPYFAFGVTRDKDVINFVLVYDSLAV